ncbi:MAG: DUF58 domain-containing protein [Protaetiibacter sp.]
MPVPDALLRRLDWRLLRRLDGRLLGSHRTTARGEGLDLAEVRLYDDGEDARRIDWNATARFAAPHARVFHEDRETTVWLVVDASASVRPRARRTLDELADALVRLFARTGNPVGAVVFDGVAASVLPPARGRAAQLRIGAALEATAAARGGETDLAAMLDAVARAARRRSLVIVLSDLVGAGDWGGALLRLAGRAEVAVIRVVDAAERVLPPVGTVLVEDAETGEQLLVDAADPGFRARLDAAHAQHDAEVRSATHRAAAALHTVDAQEDPGDALVRIVAATARRRR